MKWLGNQGADVNTRDNIDETPMHGAARKNSLDAMKWLEAQGADITAKSRSGLTSKNAAIIANANIFNKSLSPIAVMTIDWLKSQEADFDTSKEVLVKPC